MYCGCKTCCSKLTWTASILLLLAAAAGLAAGLYVTVPCVGQLNKCIRSPEANTAANQCWSNFWTCTKSGNAGGLFFFLAVAGAACFILSLLTCCCFCCQHRPGAPKKQKQGKHQEQFVASSDSATTPPVPASAPAYQETGVLAYNDAAAQHDQIVIYPEPGVKPSTARV